MYLSEPVANCSAKTRTQDTKLLSRSIPRMPDDFYDSFIQYGTDLGAECATQSGGELDAGPHMSTATTARDMLSIVDAFAATEDGQRSSKPSDLLNYYGISYGTFLGQTFASMFPDRVGNMVLDGVVDPEDYLTSLTRNSVERLDGVIAGFFIYCHEAGPSGCSYDTGSSAKDIYERFNRSFVRLDAEKAKEENWPNATDIESALLNLKVALLASAYAPGMQFSMLADVLLDLEHALSAQKLRKWTAGMVELYGDPSPDGFENAPFALGVLCSDQNNRWYNKTLEDFRPLLAELDGQSIIGDVWIKTLLGCSGWSIKATEIFAGPFGGNTATPILFVGNTYDPVTPSDNALSSAQNYKDAQALIVDGFGHAINPTQNLCGFSKIAKYFRTGEMPGNDSFCAFEGGSLGVLLNGTLEENIFRAGLSNLLA
ncbi:hypothetical protein SLS63_008609 [Diaporthe eres]|uniref:Peptidase S33 tripeptidyl aminopeptidase-like C-terminal domain-containing protein n=1 Tax=Diaporthe eres TaxID=83184 RepID=A0ABR1P280_DIAER